MSVELSEEMKKNLKEAYDALDIVGGGGRREVHGTKEESPITLIRFPGGVIVGPKSMHQTVIDYLATLP